MWLYYTDCGCVIVNKGHTVCDIMVQSHHGRLGDQHWLWEEGSRSGKDYVDLRNEQVLGGFKSQMEGRAQMKAQGWSSRHLKALSVARSWGVWSEAKGKASPGAGVGRQPQVPMWGTGLHPHAGLNHQRFQAAKWCDQTCILETIQLLWAGVRVEVRGL